MNEQANNLAAALRDIFAAADAPHRYGPLMAAVARARTKLTAYEIAQASEAAREILARDIPATPPEPVRVAIFVRGGCVQDISASVDSVEYHLIDADNIEDEHPDEDDESPGDIWGRITDNFYPAIEATTP